MACSYCGNRPTQEPQPQPLTREEAAERLRSGRSAKSHNRCTAECERMPRCIQCGRRKAPVGRDVAPAEGSGYCTLHGCEGYRLNPRPGHLWPGEVAQQEDPLK